MRVERVLIEEQELRVELQPDPRAKGPPLTLCLRLERAAEPSSGSPESDRESFLGRANGGAPSVPAGETNAPAVRFGRVATKSARFARVLKQLAALADEELGILLLGETGTGKEHLARAVHEASPRSGGPFHAINCAAIPEHLIASELFGHKKGAFTGAQHDRLGAFRAARGGTLFLDEIGDAPASVQLALLRALESRRITPLGTDREEPVDVRVVAATSRDLDDLRKRGVFRDDLYYRLAELTLKLPALRDRREDLPLLCETLLESFGSSARLSFQTEAMLRSYSFPGNVRELASLLRRAVGLSRGASTLQTVHFTPLSDGAASEADDGTPFESYEFPEEILALGARLREGKGWPDLRDKKKRERRALRRAALLSVAREVPREAWTPGLRRKWRRMFGAGWDSSEGGRGAREVARVLGVDVEAVRRMVAG